MPAMQKYNVSIKGLIAKGQYTLYSALIEKLTFFVFFVYLARRIELVEYGSIVTAFAFANILTNFFELGFGPYFQRETSSNNIALKEEVETALAFKLFILPFFITLLFVYNIFFYKGDTILLLIIGTSIYFFSLNLIFTSILYGKNLYSKSFYALLYSRIFIIAATILLFILFGNLYFVFCSLLIGSMIQSYILIVFLNSQGIHTRAFVFRKKVLQRILASSLPIGIGISFVFVYDKIDVVLIENMIGPVAVAFYSVGYSIYKLPQLLSSVFLVPLFSDFSNMFHDRNNFSLSVLVKPASALVIISLLLIAGINITSRFLLTMIYGAKFLNSIWILNLLSIALPGLFLNGLTGVTLNSLKKEKLVMYSGFAAMTTNILVNLLLLKKIGISGAIIATIITEYMNFIIQFFIILSISKSRLKQVTLT